MKGSLHLRQLPYRVEPKRPPDDQLVGRTGAYKLLRLGPRLPGEDLKGLVGPEVILETLQKPCSGNLEACVGGATTSTRSKLAKVAAKLVTEGKSS